MSALTTAQTNLDSLFTIWKDKTQVDSIRVKAYYEFIMEGVLFQKPDSAYILAEELLTFSENNQYPKAKAYAFNIKGTISKNQGNYSQALKYQKNSLKITENIGDKGGIAKALNDIGIIYYYQGNYPLALNYYQHSLKIKEEIGDLEGAAKSLGNIGIIFKKQANYPQALNYYQRSLNIKEEIGYKRGIAKSLNSIGLLHNVKGNYSQALDYFKRSLIIEEDFGNKEGIASLLNNFGNTYLNQKKYQLALDYYQRSLKIKIEIGDKVGTAISLGNIGVIYRAQGNYTKALKYHQQSLKIREEIGNKVGIAKSLNSIGNDYLGQNKYKLAITNCLQSLNIGKEIGLLDLQKDACSCLYKAYKGLGNGTKALEFHEQILVLNDSLQSEETAKKLQQMEFAKQVLADSLLQVEKDLQVEMAHQAEVRKKDNNKNLAIGAGIFFLLLSGGLYSRWRYVKKSKAVIEKEKDRSENLLLNILPSEIAEELKAKGSAEARDFDMVSILFTDFKGFTQVSETLTAQELIEEINVCFKAFDHICEKHGIEKIKTIGDAYMAAGGLPVPSEDSIKNTVLAALEMQSFISNRILEKDKLNEMSFKMRLGIHTGPVVAGIVGVNKFQYDIWGDTVNTAARMESSGEIGKVNVSEDAYKLLKHDPAFTFESRGKIQVKGKGKVQMYFVTQTNRSINTIF